jgi:hypothetical protein
MLIIIMIVITSTILAYCCCPSSPLSGSIQKALRSSKSPPASQDDQKAVLRPSNFVFWFPLTDAGRHRISALFVLGVMIIMLKIEMMVRIALAIF